MKKFYSFLLLAMITVVASAQVTFNAKAGIGLSSCIGGNLDSKSHFVGKAGFGIEYPLSSNISFMPSLEFAIKGAKFEEAFEEYGSIYTCEENVTLYYLQLPILFAYRFNVSNRLNMVVKAGPYFAYGVAGNISFKETFGSSGSSKEDDMDVFDIAKRFECGIDVGLDFEFKKFVVGVEYEVGITPFVDYGDETSMWLRNQAFYATVGYKF